MLLVHFKILPFMSLSMYNFYIFYVERSVSKVFGKLNTSFMVLHFVKVLLFLLDFFLYPLIRSAYLFDLIPRESL